MENSAANDEWRLVANDPPTKEDEQNSGEVWTWMPDCGSAMILNIWWDTQSDKFAGFCSDCGWISGITHWKPIVYPALPGSPTESASPPSMADDLKEAKRLMQMAVNGYKSGVVMSSSRDGYVNALIEMEVFLSSHPAEAGTA